MKALVTGATGFVGQKLVQRLRAEGVAVAALARPETDRSRIDHLGPIWVEGSLADLEPSRPAIAAFGPDLVFHLGWGGVGRKGRDDRMQVDANLLGTLRLFDTVADLGCRTFIGLGSQAEYGPNPEKIDESTPLHPTTLYGAAKASAHLILDRLAQSRGVRLAWLRLFSAYGPGDHPDCMIPTVIRTLFEGGRPRLSSGVQPWDFLYADDAAEAIARVGMSATAAGVFNLASGQTTTIRAVVERIRDAIDPSLPLGLGDLPDPDGGPVGLRADVSKLIQTTGWKPRTSLDEGLRRTVAALDPSRVSVYQPYRPSGAAA